jgi:uncharacterized protein YjhX (UPF0386 family)
MRLFHEKNGYHFESCDVKIKEMKEAGWVEAMEGFPYATVKDEVIAVTPQRGRPKAK